MWNIASFHEKSHKNNTGTAGDNIIIIITDASNQNITCLITGVYGIFMG